MINHDGLFISDFECFHHVESLSMSPSFRCSRHDMAACLCVVNPQSFIHLFYEYMDLFHHVAGALFQLGKSLRKL